MDGLMKYYILLCLFFSGSVFSGYGQKSSLKFRKDERFKIVQMTDLHISLKSGKSEICFNLIREAIESEKPDLLVFTGDVVTEHDPQEAWTRLTRQLDSSGVAWTIVFGNHEHEQEMTHEEIFRIVSDSPRCLMERGKVKGLGNYVLKIAGSASTEPAAVLYFLDSHGNCEESGVGGYQWIDFSQIAWFRDQDRKHHLPALAFFHIPLPEYNEVLKGKITGEQGEEVCAPKLNSGLFTAMKEGGNITGVFVGHDHENDYVGTLYGITLAYGRFSGGKNTYGKLSPGFRVIELTEGKREIVTYVEAEGVKK